ncbi:DUF3991 and toprim domain-containing protein [Ruminococcaceae bacterium OttesenSCG-928-L11]|nr:DUF3991 and toprim domain-containing protein [Ruminococcaceae bacterium OttesenSCG-928-L11]
MPGVTEEQIARAKQVDILEYMQRHEPGNLVRQGPNRFILRNHDSFVISNGKWCWNSRDYGCETGTALNYLIDVRGLGFVDAVRTLCDDISLSYEPAPPKSPPPPKKFGLPPRNRNNDRVIAYLRGRGIDRELIDACIASGILYESATYHNCVFTGKNEQEKTRFGCMRGIKGDFRRDLDGSDKRYGFLLPPAAPERCHRLAVMEAPIDALSHQTLWKMGYDIPDCWRLATGGNSILAVEHFLRQHPEVDECLVCTDADEVGERLARKISALTTEQDEFAHVAVGRAAPPVGKDYNNTLQAVLQTEREANTPHRHGEDISL